MIGYGDGVGWDGMEWGALGVSILVFGGKKGGGGIGMV